MDVDVNAQFKKGRQGSRGDRKITCNVCDKVGHIMKDCWILQDHVNLLYNCNTQITRLCSIHEKKAQCWYQREITFLIPRRYCYRNETKKQKCEGLATYRVLLPTKLVIKQQIHVHC
ncbi:hypothetical protein BDF21DRAFT_396612 [Thamnidium elegans]|nr:hypothetical protein BDF21DRAFT_485238 [Thamnidium elegans]KAI8088469.1 hypothetical protein BDF21DRAFT_396612 [Thamnidium elegans]